MPRFVNLPTIAGDTVSVRVDRVESVSHAWNAKLEIDESRTKVITYSGDAIPVNLPKPEVMELLGLHLTGNGEEWV